MTGIEIEKEMSLLRKRLDDLQKLAGEIPRPITYNSHTDGVFDIVYPTNYNCRLGNHSNAPLSNERTATVKIIKKICGIETGTRIDKLRIEEKQAIAFNDCFEQITALLEQLCKKYRKFNGYNADDERFIERELEHIRGCAKEDQQ